MYVELHAHSAYSFLDGASLPEELAVRAHVTLLVETPRGYANLCRLLTAAHAGTRPPGREDEAPLEPSLALELLLEHRDGLVCLSGCARHGLAVRNPNAAARLAAAFGPERFYVELQRPYER